MTAHKESKPDPRPRRLPDRGHSDDACGFIWDGTCDECRKIYWPERHFTDRAPARPFGPEIPRPRINPNDLIQALHHWRSRSAVKGAILDLILDDLVEIILDLTKGAKR